QIKGQQLIEMFEGERQVFVRELLKCSTMKKTWAHIDVVDAMKKLQCDRMRIVKALNYFSEKSWIELKVAGLVHGYRKRKAFGSTEELAEQYFKRVTDRETAEVNRTRQFFEFVKANQCQAAYLSAHFGQPLEEPCGNCTFCVGQGNLEIPEAGQDQLSVPTILEVQQLVTSHPGALTDSRSVARFLCGITSPALTRAKLSKHSMFGTCESIPFDSLLRQLASEVQFETEPPF
ncbi:MAG: RecQ family zinc-binding domain-containing protein, partial [Planctomycetota bacterium]